MKLIINSTIYKVDYRINPTNCKLYYEITLPPALSEGQGGSN
jgi:hypothetical protein